MPAWTYANTSDMTHTPDTRQLGSIKAALFLICLLPVGRLLWAAYTGDFGPNPVEFVQRWTGTWTFNLLLATLCVTPLRVISGVPWLGRLRRMLGLFTFFYAALHFLSYIGFDHTFDVDAIARDIFKRPFVTVGFLAFVGGQHLRMFTVDVHVVLPQAGDRSGTQTNLSGITFGFGTENVEFFAANAQHFTQ